MWGPGPHGLQTVRIVSSFDTQIAAVLVSIPGACVVNQEGKSSSCLRICWESQVMHRSPLFFTCLYHFETYSFENFHSCIWFKNWELRWLAVTCVLVIGNFDFAKLDIIQLSKDQMLTFLATWISQLNLCFMLNSSNVRDKNLGTLCGGCYVLSVFDAPQVSPLPTTHRTKSTRQRSKQMRLYHVAQHFHSTESY
jgi:hypothetical protein